MRPPHSNPRSPSDLSVVEAVSGRRSVRRFLSDPVDDGVVRAILQTASRAASGVNMQPWLVHVATGETRARLSRVVRAAAEAGETSLEYAYLPQTIPEPYLSRRRKLGFDLYALQGIAREDRPARQAAMLRNYDFFGAPVGLFFTLDRSMTSGSWLDCGMYMQSVMVVARAYGLETCPQQAWCDFGGLVHRELDIPETQILLSGMALGRADEEGPENRLFSERAPVESFTTWHD